MANKEKLEQLIEHIKRLTLLTEEIYEREIYPVSFFSKAYDITSTIQEELRQIEVVQIELFEKQMKEHQAQILSIVPPSVGIATPKTPPPAATELPTQPEIGPLFQPVMESPVQPATAPKETLVHTDQPVETVAPAPAPVTVPPPPPPPRVPIPEETVNPQPVSPPPSPPLASPVQETKKVLTNYTSDQTNRIDLKKMITLNDRFLFCRELFSNDENLMNRTITDLNKEESFEASMDYLKNHFNWDLEDEHVVNFIAGLKKRFS